MTLFRSANRNCADAFLAPPRLDELEDGVAEVVDEARVAGVAVPFEPAHLRHDVGDGGVADRHQVERRPRPALVVGQAFVDPQRHAPADERLRDDVELEVVRELVDDEAVQPIRRIVDRQQHAIAERLGERADAFLRRRRESTFCCSNSLCVLNRISGTLIGRSCFRSELIC